MICDKMSQKTLHYISPFFHILYLPLCVHLNTQFDFFPLLFGIGRAGNKKSHLKNSDGGTTRYEILHPKKFGLFLKQSETIEIDTPHMI